MNTLAAGSKFKVGNGHITETISEDSISIMFNNCRVENIYLRVEQFYIHCLQSAYKKFNIQLPVFPNHYIQDCLNNLVLFIREQTESAIFSMGIIVHVKSNNNYNYLKFSIIAPGNPESFHLIEKI